MDRSALPETAFLAPDGANRAAVEALFAQASNLLLDLAGGAAARPPLRLDGRFVDAEIPQRPRPEGEILGGLRELLEDAMNPAHPGYIGHMDSLPSTFSVIGAMAAAAANNNLLSLEMSPSLSRLEVALMRQLAKLFGLPAGAGGVMASGGSLANLLALGVARNRAFDVAESGLCGQSAAPLLFASEAAHGSLQKAAMVLGLGRAAVVAVKSPRDRLCPRALAVAIAAARDDGKAPFAVVATAGTTVTGAIDPLAEIAAVAGEAGLWLHVDAAYGGALIFSRRERHRLAGIDLADSVTFNPQKWLYVAKSCALCLFRRRDDLEQGFRSPQPYMADAGGFTNLGELGPQGTRSAEVLKLWLTLQHFGHSGIAALVEGGQDLAARFRDGLARRPTVEICDAGDSNLVCFRPRDAADSVVASLQAELLRRGFFLSQPPYRGRRWLRIVALNPYCAAAEVAAFFAALDASL